MNQGEYYLTDAFQYMVDHGSRIMTAPVEGWWDAGKPETLLETNHHLLLAGRGGIDPLATVEDAEIIEVLCVEWTTAHVRTKRGWVLSVHRRRIATRPAAAEISTAAIATTIHRHSREPPPSDASGRMTASSPPS